MSTELETRERYDHILAQVAQLDPQIQMELLIDLAVQLRQSLGSKKQKKRCINELRGLFKGVWTGQDAQDYVNQERDSWAG